MSWVVENLWLIPAVPMAAGLLLALTRQPFRRFAATLAIGAMAFAFIMSLLAFSATLGKTGGATRLTKNFTWFEMGDSAVRLGWVLDPLTAIMLVMVTLVGLLIFIYSVGYMAHDENFTRFFCFMSIFAGAMLGVVIANNLLLLFMCWELVGLASYLLIGFWYHKPEAAAAAKKAFIVTRIGDMGFFLGILWLYSQTGTLLFYDGGNGCLEKTAIARLVAFTTVGGMALTVGIGLLIFCGAIGKSGQVPLHVWLPDAMEGPTPVSALIHAATMVAAGVFLMARVYPLLNPSVLGIDGSTSALNVVTWVGAITALMAASIAVAQTDIKRILAYSTVSQLGFMMMGLGTGGVAVAMFHLITHAFFKALLFLGAGSIIHGCHEEQDIRKMGGLRKWMPVTFATYAIGMMALSGVPLLSGFWSKDEILHSSHAWAMSRWPFWMGVAGAFLTAFYMTRQMSYVFFGNSRGGEAHESPRVMTIPLTVLALFAAVLGLMGTPAWPWFQEYLHGSQAKMEFANLFHGGAFGLMMLSSAIAFAGIGAGWMLYGNKPKEAGQADVLERALPDGYTLLRKKFYVDEFYEWFVVGSCRTLARVIDWFDEFIWGGIVRLTALATLAVSWMSRVFDEHVVNFGFDWGNRQLRTGGGLLARLQNGKVQSYLRVIGVAFVVLVLLFMWGCRAT